MPIKHPAAIFGLAVVVSAFFMMILYTSAGGFYVGTNAARDISERPAPAARAPAAEETEEVAAEPAAAEETSEVPVETAVTETEEPEPVVTVSAYPDLAGDPANGAAIFRQCAACHVADRADNRAGPHLVGLLGRDIGTVSDFRYSDVLIEMTGQWTPDELDAWLKSPQAYAPGTRMAYRGVADPTDRQDLIKYLSQY